MVAAATSTIFKEGQSHNKQERSLERISNEYTLYVAFVSFVGFMLIQGLVALYIAHSQSMLADSEAMSVDAFTYLFNLLAERIKNRPLSDAEKSMPHHVLEFRLEVKRLWLELVPPLISVVTLIVVTMVTLNEATRTLFRKSNDGNDDADADVSAGYMLLFSGLNLLLDVVNVTCFARAHQAYGLQKAMSVDELLVEDNYDDPLTRDYKRAMMDTMKDDESTYLLENGDQSTAKDGKYAENDDNGANEFQQLKSTSAWDPSVPSLRVSMASRRRGSMTGAVPETQHELEENFFLDSCLGVVNLNMCSAWTHICADTMRSIAVLVAATIAFLFKQVPADKADSAAAIAVSITILVSLLPLLRGLAITARELVIEYRRYKLV